jgi:hypothetical protein
MNPTFASIKEATAPCVQILAIKASAHAAVFDRVRAGVVGIFLRTCACKMTRADYVFIALVAICVHRFRGRARKCGVCRLKAVDRRRCIGFGMCTIAK